MDDKQKRACIMNRVKHWTKFLGIDPKFNISIAIAADDQPSGDDEPPNEALKHEELLVSTLERALVGPREFMKARQLSARVDGRTLAIMDDSSAQYLEFRFIACPALMSFDNDDFELMVDCAACHESLHMLLWPYSSYVTSLEAKGS